MMPAQRRVIRNVLISMFVVVWLGVFHYESLRAFYLNPLFHRALPKVKFLFPPAGWIMFYHVDDRFGFAEVYGVTRNIPRLIDPHDIFQTRTIMFDNIHRNVLSAAADERYAGSFCRFLERKFPYFDNFFVTAVYYPHLFKDRHEHIQQVKYVCR